MTDVTPGTPLPPSVPRKPVVVEITETLGCGARLNEQPPTADVVKQIIVLRADLGMPPGKAASQAAHASIRFLTERVRPLRGNFPGGNLPKGTYLSDNIQTFSEAEKLWIEGQFTKIVCRAYGEEEIWELHHAARRAGLESNVIVDSGNTVFDGVPTLTALAIGPDFTSKLDPVTGYLELF